MLSTDQCIIINRCAPLASKMVDGYGSFCVLLFSLPASSKYGQRTVGNVRNRGKNVAIERHKNKVPLLLCKAHVPF